MGQALNIKSQVAVGFLAGGLARRMGGGDKGLLQIAGKSILQRQIEACSGHQICIINANGDKARFAPFDLPVISDNLKGNLGPLAGILACLDYMAEHHLHIEAVLSCATDAPFIPVDLAEQLERVRAEKQAIIATAESFGRRHPVFGLWPVWLRQELRSALTDKGIRKIDDFTARYDVAVDEFSGDPDPFLNVNRPEDMEQACLTVLEKQN